MEILASGRDADVFAHGDGLVLRRYRDGRSAEAEGVLMWDLAQLGYPVPRVESGTGSDLVMEHVDGPTMVAQLSRATSIPRMEAPSLLGSMTICTGFRGREGSRCSTSTCTPSTC